MNDLQTRVDAFLRGPCIIGEPWRLMCQYVDGKLWDDPEAENLLSLCLQAAQTEVATLEGATAGPARDARYFYQKTAELLAEIKAEVSARRQQDSSVCETPPNRSP
jgi:hypothetical protein